jgi:hypothetical protein
MNNRTQTFQLSALATIVAAVLTTGMAIQWADGSSSEVRQRSRGQVSLWADGITPPPVPKLPPPKALAANS